MKKRLTSQPEALSDEGYHETTPPVGSLAFFHLGTEQGGPARVDINEKKKFSFRHCPNHLTITLSGNFPDHPENIQPIRKLSRLSGKFPDNPENIQTI